MKSTKIALTMLGTGALALSLGACASAPSTNTAANKSNTAVVTNTNSAATTNTSAGNAAAANAATTGNTASIANMSSSATGGDTVTIESAGIAVTAPKGFKIQKDGETTNLISPDDGFEVYFHVPKDGDYNKAIDEITTEIDDYIKDVKVEGKGQNTTINGIPAFIQSGTGKDKETDKMVGWDLTVLQAPKKPVLVVSYADESVGTKYDAAIADMVKSIRKL